MTIRWGIIGCGDVVRKRVASAILGHSQSELVAACRRNEQKLNSFCDEYDVPQRFASAEQLIAADGIDAVYIATPVNLHAPLAIAAMQAGKHVLVEKPMAISPKECEQMLAASESTGRQLGVAYYRRFYPVYLRMKKLLDEAALGNLLSIQIVTSAPLPPPGSDGFWRVDLKQGGGGPLMDVGSHRLDLLIDMLGMPQAVSARTSRVAASYESENVASLLMEFGGGTQVSLTCLFGAATDPDVWTMVGTKAIVEATPLNSGKLRTIRGDSTSEEHHPPNPNFNIPLIEDFVEAIQKQTQTAVCGKSGLAVNQIMAMAYGK